ncbi:MAG: superoxide dismutase [Succinivibrionaceae bacterium]
MFTLPELPYAKNALVPFISEETLTFHHDKHFKTYVDKLNSLISGTDYENLSLKDIIQKSAKDGNQAVFNNAGQVYNHDFYFKCLAQPCNEKNCPCTAPVLKKLIGNTYSDPQQFREELLNNAIGNFGSGWTWVVKHGDKIEIVNYSNADNPLRDRENDVPLLCIDVWEHAYYIDYRNDRKSYVEKLFNVINWQFVASQLQ